MLISWFRTLNRSSVIFADAGADYITVHAEAVTHLHKVVSSIHQGRCQCRDLDRPLDAGILYIPDAL